MNLSPPNHLPRKPRFLLKYSLLHRQDPISAYTLQSQMGFEKVLIKLCKNNDVFYVGLSNAQKTFEFSQT
uniref:Putative ovule protein n=1 Tax=Solanum chacoense TaxID=4108 RepID=A0A0V0GNN7_SOLCH